MAFRMDLPDIGEGVVEAEVQRWFVAPGDVVQEDQPLVEVMTDKATVVIPSPRRGRIVRLFWNVGDVAKVHAPLVEIEVEGEAAQAASSGAPAPSPAPRSVSPRAAGGEGRGEEGHKALATPAVRAMARELGVDVNAVAGTGPGGRVTKDDLAAHRTKRNGHAPTPPTATPPPTATQPPTATPPSAPTGTPTPTPVATSPADQRMPLRGVRKRIAEHMALAKRTAAHFTFVEQADVTELVRVRERMAEAAQAEGVKLTFLPFVVKAVVAALRRHPKLNATMDEGAGELVLHRRYDLGIASATDAGLVVPVLRRADRRSLLDVAREIDRLSADTKAGRIGPEDLGRSTFTITSLGALGGLFATPVLNVPEVGILGLHRIRPTPVVRDGQVVVRDVMHVSVTCDHRVVDGHEAAAFAYEVIRHLEDPNLVFMHLA
ncbi:MAG TPA: dihydrolipoamide acetyltransferase family protein [Anaeromyxobacter sp.]|nr:dihydrolipoamide acetyltransferase family protein [Anaeromyxobacter sp.]